MSKKIEISKEEARDLEIGLAADAAKAKLTSMRFDYVEYDKEAMKVQAAAKALMIDLEHFIETSLNSPRAKALALTHAETVYMWIGKAVRDDQIARNGSAPLQEKRNNE